ncbi:hypothetical protein DFH06DRAFT_1166668 [Mycena polygramma]|nr:hypothetical protein DFH06DRAFT_1166668 [Mycena polygramma]
MDEQIQSQPESTTQTVRHQHTSSPDGYTGGLFPKAKDFNISGGNFTSVAHIHNAAPATPADFRMIPLGDLDLLHKIDRPGSGVVQRRRRGPAVTRRIYAAQIPGFKSKVTAAVYEGDGAEEEWREEITRYANLRHPNLVQLYGIVKTQNLHATVFHDDLIPFIEFRDSDRYRNSHWSAVYFYASLEAAFADVNIYMQPLLRRKLRSWEYTVWIRRTTGRHCIDLTPDGEPDSAWGIGFDSRFELSGTSLLEPPTDSELIGSMSLEDYRGICYVYLGLRQRPFFFISTDITVKLGSIRHVPTAEYEDSFEIARVPCRQVHDYGWATRLADLVSADGWIMVSCDQAGTVLMRNGWIRVNSADVAKVYLRQIRTSSDASLLPSWLEQANHIFDCLNVTWNFEDYVCIDSIIYRVKFSASTDNLPPGYLFLCPLADFGSELSACFRKPDCPVYWSLDPFGAELLSADEASALGFPDIDFEMKVVGRTWDDNVYAGIHRFQEAKGLDPRSQEAAMAMGCPLIEISCDRDALFAHLQQSSLKIYHATCSDKPGRWQYFWISTSISAKLGSICHFPGTEYEESFEIGVVPGCQVNDSGWSTRDPIVVDVYNPVNCNQEGISSLEHGLIRCALVLSCHPSNYQCNDSVNSADVAGMYRRRIWVDSGRSWLAQANHLFDRFEITCNFQHFFLIDVVDYWLELSAPTNDLPSGYLFLCPLADLQSDFVRFRTPDCPAYWSLDPSGTDRLTTDEARTVGFPDIHLRRAVLGRSWDDEVYAEIRQFHQFKGFDPYSREAAIATGCPLLEVIWDRDAVLAYFNASGAVDESSG